MPAIKRFAGMVRFYKRLTQKASCVESTRINHHVDFHENASGQMRFSGSSEPRIRFGRLELYADQFGWSV